MLNNFHNDVVGFNTCLCLHQITLLFLIYWLLWLFTCLFVSEHFRCLVNNDPVQIVCATKYFPRLPFLQIQQTPKTR